LHFLEDSFAAGHVAGNWGKTAVRLGTDNYYSEHGVEVITWNGSRFVTLGDGYMRAEDAKRAAAAVRDSLAQLASAFADQLRVGVAPENLANIGPEAFSSTNTSRAITGLACVPAVRRAGREPSLASWMFLRV
jgi:hypothetical protein